MVGFWGMFVWRQDATEGRECERSKTGTHVADAVTMGGLFSVVEVGLGVSIRFILCVLGQLPSDGILLGKF